MNHHLPNFSEQHLHHLTSGLLEVKLAFGVAMDYSHITEIGGDTTGIDSGLYST